jgi:hypothetical protein
MTTEKKKVHVYCRVHQIVRFEVEAESLEEAAKIVDNADADALYKMEQEVVTDAWLDCRENLLRPDEVSWLDGESGYVKVTWDREKPILGEEG